MITNDNATSDKSAEAASILQNWLKIEVEDYQNNNFLEDFQNQHFDSFLSSVGLLLLPQRKSVSRPDTTYHFKSQETSLWLLQGKHLIDKISAKIVIAKQQSSASIAKEVHVEQGEECFEGYLDCLSGDGRGVLKKINAKSGLYEYSAAGNFVNGNLHGKVRERKSCSYIRDIFYHHGTPHGIYRSLLGLHTSIITWQMQSA